MSVFKPMPKAKRIPNTKRHLYAETSTTDFMVVASPNTNTYWIYWEQGDVFWHKDFKTNQESIAEIAKAIAKHHPVEGWYNGKEFEL